MMGLVFLASFIIFIATLMCLLAYLSRNHGDSWLYRWLPPFCYGIEYPNKTLNRCVLWCLFGVLFLVLIALAVRVASGFIETGGVLTSKHHSSSFDGEKVVVIVGNQLIPQEEWSIHHPDLQNKNFKTAEVILTKPTVFRTTKDSETKLVEHHQVDTEAVRTVYTDGLLYVYIESNVEPAELITTLKESDSVVREDITADEIKRVVQHVWRKAPAGVTYKLGTIKALSNKQSIVGVRVFNKFKLDKEVTITIDKRMDKVSINHRSLLSLRKVLASYRQPTRLEETKQKSLEVDEFIPVSPQYTGKQVEVIKRDGLNVLGEFQGIENNKVVNVVQRVGSGVVNVITPLEIIKTLEFRSLTVVVEALPIDDDSVNIIYVDEMGVPIEEEEPVTMEEAPKTTEANEDKSDISIDTAVNQGVINTESKEDELLNEIGKYVLVTTNLNQTRVGTLIEVIPHKSITVQSTNGGVVYHIPQAEVKSISYPKKPK